MKFAIHTFGCKVNIYESEYIINLLQDESYELVEFNESADIYIINTCTVTNMSDKKSRQMIRKAKQLNEKSVVFCNYIFDILGGKSAVNILVNCKNGSETASAYAT